ncbi:hypothetical protein XENORESO_012854 [Xenotaenia resolanae]|uniref:Uncharacterized protein n=1 Tax=Xenotaenia resolanae TaxID=208358 RepID=A0ABV0WGX7_9TELE
MGWAILSNSDVIFTRVFLSCTTCTGYIMAQSCPFCFLPAVGDRLQVFRSTPCTPKRSQSPQQVDSALTLPVKNISVVAPVQFIVKVNTRVLKRVHSQWEFWFLI